MDMKKIAKRNDVELYKCDDGYVLQSKLFGGFVATTPDEAERIALALLDDLGKGWKKYIPGESEPEIEKTMRYRVTVQGRNGNIFEFHDTWADGKWTKYDGYVIAFQLPAPYQLEEEMELTTGKLDKIMSLEAKYAIGGAIKYTKNAMTSPLDDEQIADFVSRFMAPYCNDYDFSITKRTPEIAPCPNPECRGECKITKLGIDTYQVVCECGYRGPKGYSVINAINLSNEIAGKGKRIVHGSNLDFGSGRE